MPCIMDDRHVSHPSSVPIASICVINDNSLVPFVAGSGSCSKLEKRQCIQMSCIMDDHHVSPHPSVLIASITVIDDNSVVSFVGGSESCSKLKKRQCIQMLCIWMIIMYPILLMYQFLAPTSLMIIV